METPIDSFKQNEEVREELSKILAAIRENNKLFKSIQKSLTLIYDDRDLLKDIIERQGGLKELILALDKHNELLTKDVRQDVIKAQEIVQDKSEEVKDTVEHHTGNIQETIDNKKVLVARKSKGLLEKIKNYIF